MNLNSSATLHADKDKQNLPGRFVLCDGSRWRTAVRHVG